MRRVPKFHWPASQSGWLLVLLCAGPLTVVLIVALTAALVDHSLAYALRVKVVSLFADEPGVVLEFQREPADRPVLASGTAETPMIVMDPCVVSDTEGYHLFFSSFFCDTPQGLSLCWKPEFDEQFDPQKLTTGIAYAFSRGGVIVTRRLRQLGLHVSHCCQGSRSLGALLHRTREFSPTAW